jgi:hypothetical protein
VKVEFWKYGRPNSQGNECQGNNASFSHSPDIHSPDNLSRAPAEPASQGTLEASIDTVHHSAGILNNSRFSTLPQLRFTPESVGESDLVRISGLARLKSAKGRFLINASNALFPQRSSPQNLMAFLEKIELDLGGLKCPNLMGFSPVETCSCPDSGV